jgi:putative membrane protein
MGWGGWTMMLLFWLIVIGLIAWFVATLLRRDRGAAPRKGREDDRAESLLRERYARDEIDEETYRRKLDELRRS